jgi:hypothetical protein
MPCQLPTILLAYSDGGTTESLLVQVAKQHAMKITTLILRQNLKVGIMVLGSYLNFVNILMVNECDASIQNTG